MTVYIKSSIISAISGITRDFGIYPYQIRGEIQYRPRRLL